jgi:hypothetical protein
MEGLSIDLELSVPSGGYRFETLLRLRYWTPVDNAIYGVHQGIVKSYRYIYH